LTSRGTAGRVPADITTRGRLDTRRPRVYVHIGEPKTGTTFLQRAMWDNRARLAAQGVLLPGYRRQDHNRASRDLREAPRPASDPADPWTGEWDVLVGQALLAPRVAVISDEVLAACNPPQADRAVRSLLEAEVHVILTVRDFATLLPAEWQETVKCRGTAGWEEWLSGVIDAASADSRRLRPFWMLHDTLAILDMWSRLLPPDQVHVITMPRQGQDGTLWTRFASVLGVDPGRADLTGARANSSLGIGEAEFLRRMNEALTEEMPDWFYTRTIKRVLAHDVLDARLRRGRLVVPPDREAWVRQQSEILITGLRESKFHIVGDLGELVPQPAAGPYHGPADQPPEQLLDAAVAAAAALADHEYRVRYLPRPRRDRPHGLRQAVSRIKWALLNGRRVKRTLRRASRFRAVQRLRIVIWRVLQRPARYGR
jgi:hypothetical protein